MRFVRIGRTVVNLDAVRRSTGLEPSFVITGPDAEQLRAHLDALAVPWKPIIIGDHPHGPLGHARRLD